jgi:hypothetical protein
VALGAASLLEPLEPLPPQAASAAVIASTIRFGSRQRCCTMVLPPSVAERIAEQSVFETLMNKFCLLVKQILFR